MSREDIQPNPSEFGEVVALQRQIQERGQGVARMALQWYDTEGQAAIVETERSRILIESNLTGEHATITVLTESIARVGADGPVHPHAIFRRQGNPDSEIEVGRPLDILGMSRKSREFDFDSIFTTTPVTGLTLLQRV